jgi:hypothetical protein
MNARPLRWWSRTALDAAAAAFAPAWQAWGAGWDLAAGRAVAVNAFDPGDDAPAVTRWQRCPQGAAWLGLTATTAPAELLAGLLFGDAATTPHDTAERGSLAATVGAAAWADLLAAFGLALPTLRSDASQPRAGASAATQEPSPPAAGWQAWSGAVEIRFGFADCDGAVLVLHLPAPTAAALLAAQAPVAPKAALPRLEPLEQAFARRSIRVAVELAGLQIDIGTLQSLRTGDVLTLPHRLDEPLRLCLPRKSLPHGADTALCPVLLGARDGKRAVELMRDPALA